MSSFSSEDTPAGRQPPLKQARAKRRRAQILEVARKVIARYGLAKTTMDDIARQAGVGKTSLYYYFGNKEEIFQAVVMEESELLGKKIQQAVDAATDPPAKLKAFVKARYTHLRKLRTLYRITQESVKELLPVAQSMRNHFFEREIEQIRGLLNEGIQTGSFAIVDSGPMALVMAAGIWGLDSLAVLRGLEDEALDAIDDMVGLILRGLMPRKE
ncbi:MAG: TetR/AcrR family transcriptional regulator [Deltaproteobacteria bacterium]|nr:TetR/AcrR family transcriptional regulator [Deltaproteobacteria bacterium]